MDLGLRLSAFFIGALLNGILVFGVLGRGRSRPAEQILRLFFVALFSWFAGSLLALALDRAVGPTASMVRRFGRIVAHTGLSFMPSLVLHAVLSEGRDILGSRRSWERIALAAVYAPLLGLVYPLWLLARLPERAPLDALARFIRPWNVWFAAVLISTAALAGWLGQRSTGERRRMFAALAASFVVIAVGLVFTYVFGGHRGAYGYTLETVVMASSLLPSVVFVYFVYRYRVLGYVVQDRAVSLFASITLLGFYLFVVRFVTGGLAPVMGVPERLLDGTVLIALFLVLEPYGESLRGLVRRYLAGGRERLRRRVAACATALAQARSVDEIATALATTLEGEDGVARVRLLVSGDAPHGADVAGLLHRMPMLAAEVSAGRSIVRRSTAPTSLVLAEMEELGADVAVALRTKERLHGVLLLGSDARGGIVAEETEALEPVAQNAALALEAAALMAEKLAAERRAARSERMARIGWLTASVAHEVKNPLSSIKSVAQVMLREMEPESRWRDDAAMIVGEADRLRDAVDRLLARARDDHGADNVSSGPVDLASSLDQLRLALDPVARRNDIRIDVELLPGVARVDATAEALWDILYNLATNGMEAMATGGTLRIEQLEPATPGTILLRVADTGHGVAAAIAERIFQPSFTTRDDGHGLGLAIVARRLRAIGGAIELVRSPRGATFELTLRAAE